MSYRAAWIALFIAGGALECWTLTNDVSGDTLSAQVWSALEAYPVLAVPLALFLGWLAAHWLGGRSRG